MNITKYYYALSAAYLAITLSACGGATNKQMSSDTQNMHDHAQHLHNNVDIDEFGENAAAPAIDFTIEADSMNGWNIHIHTQNFEFTPEKINSDAALGEGHAHIFVDDFKIARIYGHWFHLKALTPGKHSVRITLNTNNHATWHNKQQAISATQTIIQH